MVQPLPVELSQIDIVYLRDQTPIVPEYTRTFSFLETNAMSSRLEDGP